MSDIVLDDGGDLDIVAGDLHIHTDFVESVRQHLQIRLRFFKGEWFRNLDEGIPYYQSILAIKNPDLAAISAILTRAVLNTPGVESVDAFDAVLAPATRTLTVSFEATLDDGQTLVFTDFVL